ncbi:MAG: hypothetical protein WAM74_00090, partial [Xanthobacteraceae bacterium]
AVGRADYMLGNHVASNISRLEIGDPCTYASQVWQGREAKGLVFAWSNSPPTNQSTAVSS